MQTQRWPTIRMVLAYAFVVGKVARATLLDTLYKTISSSLQTVSVVSGTRQQNSSDYTELKCYRSYGLSTTVPSGAYSVGCLDAAASNDRSSGLCNAPLKRIA
jgi:hypothetical protein